MAQDKDRLSDLITINLAEFNSVEQEIRARSAEQSKYITFNITAVGVVIGLYFYAKSPDARILFVIPVISCILGFYWLDHHVNIASLGSFTKERLKPSFSQLVGHEGCVLDYEKYRTEHNRPFWLRFFLFSLPFFLNFVAISFVAMCVPFALVNKYTQDFLAFAILDVVLLSCLFAMWLFVVVRSISRRRR